MTTEAVVPDVVRPPPGNPRFPLVDGVRAIAVLLVFAFHAAGQDLRVSGHWWAPFAARLDVGVTVFFVVSGFLLYRPFVAARLGEAPRPRVGPYARRRALRILPAYWLALTVLAIWPGLFGVFSGHWWAYYGFLQIYRPQWLAYFQGMTQAWSLCVEMSFYVLLPLLAALLLRTRGRTGGLRARNELLALAALALASLGFRAYLGHAHPQSVWAQTLAGLFGWFAAGMGLAVVSAALTHGHRSLSGVLAHVQRRPWVCWAAAVVCFVAAARLGRTVVGVPANTGSRALVEYVLYGLIALLVMAPAVFGDDGGGAPRRLLANPLVAWIGLISYGIFLWHVTVLVKLSDEGVSGFVALFAVGLPISIACAAASYYAVERPLLRFKDGRPRRRSSPRRPARA